jgi:hypothetical protein
MLPVTVQVIIATIAHAINERMARGVDYLQEEVRVLKGGPHGGDRQAPDRFERRAAAPLGHER